MKTLKQILNEHSTVIHRDHIPSIIKEWLPQKVKPDYIPKQENQTQITVPNITQWELYNDITANVWHNEKTTLQAKQAQYNTLHKIMPLLTVT